MTCCQTSRPEDVRAEPAAYNCNDCPLLEAQQGLWPDNAEAWEAYWQLSQRFIEERGLVPEVFRALTEGWDRGAVSELLERLNLIHEILVPPPPSRGPDSA